jgi:hypothetical protein
MFRLALALGRTVAELEETMSSHELSEWMAFEAIDGPIGNQRADMRAGIIAATIANCHRTAKSKPFSHLDFMPYAEKPKTSQEQMAEMLAKAFGVKPKWKE